MLEFMEEPMKSSTIEAAANEDETDSKGDEDEAMKSRGDSVTQRSIEIYIDAQE